MFDFADEKMFNTYFILKLVSTEPAMSICFSPDLLLVRLQSDDAGAALAAAMTGAVGAAGAKTEARGNGPLPGGGGLMEEMSALLARRYSFTVAQSLYCVCLI